MSAWLESKFRSRRFIVVMSIIWNAAGALWAGVMLLAMGKSIEGLALLIGAFTAACSAALGLYGMTRNERWGAGHDTNGT